LCLARVLRWSTLDCGVGCLQGARCRDSVHLGELFVEGDVGEHTTSRRIIVAEDHHAKAGLNPNGQVQLGASKAPEFRHSDGSKPCRRWGKGATRTEVIEGASSCLYNYRKVCPGTKQSELGYLVSQKASYDLYSRIGTPWILHKQIMRGINSRSRSERSCRGTFEHRIRRRAVAICCQCQARSNPAQSGETELPPFPFPRLPP
jgi:hypothetical protein